MGRLKRPFSLATPRGSPKENGHIHNKTGQSEFYLAVALFMVGDH